MFGPSTGFRSTASGRDRFELFPDSAYLHVRLGDLKGVQLSEVGVVYLREIHPLEVVPHRSERGMLKVIRILEGSTGKPRGSGGVTEQTKDGGRAFVCYNTKLSEKTEFSGSGS